MVSKSPSASGMTQAHEIVDPGQEGELGLQVGGVDLPPADIERVAERGPRSPAGRRRTGGRYRRG